MQWFQSLDATLFHFVNGTLSNPVFDWLMPIVSGGHGALRWFALAAVLLFVTTMVRGGARGRICALLLLVVVAAGDPLVIGTIKNAIGRPRPCLALSGVVERLGCSSSGSMPSAHAANWFAAATVLFLFYRRSGWFMFPMAGLVAFSRVYCGVHYPGDITAGAILGAGYAICLVLLIQMGWNFIGRKFFPRWHQQMPSLVNPPVKGGAPVHDSLGEGGRLPLPIIRRALTLPQPGKIAEADSPVSGVPPVAIPAAADHPAPGQEWLRLGYGVIVLALAARWIYLASGLIGLSGDEAYQWLWSKHLALAYFSKPPGIALLQRAGTLIAGDNGLGVRFFAPLITAIMSLLVLRFLARETGARTAFWLLIATLATPLLVAGSVFMTIDPPLALCWMWAVLAGWRAVQPTGTTRDWVVAGFALGLGLLFKPSAVFQIFCWVIFFVVQPAARIHLRRAGPWLALLLFSLGSLPSLIWNAGHGWVTLGHLRDNAGLNQTWHPTLHYFFEFLLAEAGLLNPVFLVAVIWAACAMWQQRREKPLGLYLLCMSAPVWIGFTLYSLHSRIQPNWIAPALAPLFCLAALYWHERSRLAKRLLVGGLVPGLLASALMYDTDLLGKIIAKLPGDADPSHRVRGWSESARVIEAEGQRFDPGAFIIADRYSTAGLFSFYSPLARAALRSPDPLVYCLDTDRPVNEFYFWPEYHYLTTRHGQNALFVRLLDPYPMESGWLWKWFNHEEFDYVNIPPPADAPESITDHFESVTNLGRFEIKLRDGRVFQRLDLFGCYHLH